MGCHDIDEDPLTQCVSTREFIGEAIRALSELGNAITCLKGIAINDGFDAITPLRSRNSLLWLSKNMDASFEILTDALDAALAPASARCEVPTEL